MSARAGLSCVLDELAAAFAEHEAAGEMLGRYLITVGTASCGRSAGALKVLDAIRGEVEELGLDCDIVEVGCLGHCYAEPLVTIGRYGQRPRVFGYVDTVAIRFILRNCLDDVGLASKHFIGTLMEDGSISSDELSARNALERRVVVRNCGLVDPGSLVHYVARGGYRALERVLLRGEAGDLAELVARSGLRGRGGAGFPTGEKWRACKEASGAEKYVICNADEGDPGAFMDRTILESDPHGVIEGMVLAGLAVGASRGLIYVRAEYPLAVSHVRAALDEARGAGLIGESVLESGWAFDIEVFEAAGAFVCGEESALIASIEGLRGIPRPRPPYPCEEGLFGMPTLIDNVKTLACVRHIVMEGADWFASIGDEVSPGTAVLALAGSVARPGVVEVDMGTTLREVIFDVGGGMLDPNYEKPGHETPNVGNGGYCTAPKLPDLTFKAVQIGGPSGGCLPADKLDLPITFDSLAAEGAMMGSGGLIVMSNEDCMVEMARYFLSFTDAQSCGRCSVCRLGIRAMLRILEGLTEGRGSAENLDEIRGLAALVQGASACGLGKTAPNPVLSTLRYFEDEYRAHFERRECTALVCRELISYEFDDVGCMSMCEECCVVCDAIVSGVGWDGYRGREFRTHEIDDEKCTRCAVCVDSCAGVNHRAVHKVTPAKRDRGLR